MSLIIGEGGSANRSIMLLILGEKAVLTIVYCR